ncbi:hypothetical protein [uncultured Brevibacillus sp.]|uniref:hypothetical protein n=1 Tax=uncultured Brevibacillus sp. TaxID=169970 RepID=UPI002595936A|nr:hypothetical protein [uncultured Brevibacillus sp.]
MNQFLNPLVTQVMSDMATSPKCTWKTYKTGGNIGYYGIYIETEWDAEIQLYKRSNWWQMKIFFHHKAQNRYEHYIVNFKRNGNKVDAFSLNDYNFLITLKNKKLKVCNSDELLSYFEQFLLLA